MTLELLLGCTALCRADVSWNTLSELSGYASVGKEVGGGNAPHITLGKELIGRRDKSAMCLFFILGMVRLLSAVYVRETATHHPLLSHLPECFHQSVFESQLPDKIVD